MAQNIVDVVVVFIVSPSGIVINNKRRYSYINATFFFQNIYNMYLRRIDMTVFCRFILARDTSKYRRVPLYWGPV